MRKTTSPAVDAVAKTGKWIVLVFFLVITFIPLLWLVISSFKTDLELINVRVRSVGRAVITVRNVGSVPAFGVRVVDDVPPGMGVVRVDDGGVLEGGTVTWDAVGDLAPGRSKVLGFAYRLERVGQLVNRVSVRDRYSSVTRVDECEVFVVGPPGVSAELLDAVAGNLDADAFPVGSEFYYVASLTNEGGLPAP